MRKPELVLWTALTLSLVVGLAWSQQPPPPGVGAKGGEKGGKGRGGPPPGLPGLGNFVPEDVQKAPLFFRADWKDYPKLEQHPLTQSDLKNQNLQLSLYGAKDDLRFTQGDPTEPPHVWNGLCRSNCAMTLRDKDNYMDLTGWAQIRWNYKANGLHRIHPILKLADGTWLVGDHADGYSSDFKLSEFSLADIRWLKLDISKVVESPTGGKWIDYPDLSKVDEIGWSDLAVGSGHGYGGWSDVAWIEVYGKPVKR